jgi:NADH-quinone oxidoreductase subunit H
MDQLMNFAWRFMLPMALLNLVTVGVWVFLPQGVLRWLVCSLLVVVPYVLLGRGLTREWKLEKRVYRFAD